MTQVKIKICGLRTMSDIQIVNKVKPDYAGFIFDPTRKRYIPPEEAHILLRFLDPAITPVGVFVNASVETILQYLSECHVPVVQLHGQETNEMIEDLRSQYYNYRQTGEKLKVIKAFRVQNEADLLPALSSAADLVLLDHGIGGTGETFDWTLIRDFPRPFMLAGGLHPGNVAQAISLTRPYAVDASSGLEGVDGHKDLAKATDFVNAVRSMGLSEMSELSE